MKYFAVLLLLVSALAWAHQVSLVEDGSKFRLKNFGYVTEHCWIDFTDGDTDYPVLDPGDTSRRYKLKYLIDWDCYE